MVLGPGRAAGKGHLASHPVSTPLATWLQVVCACFPQTESLDTEPARVPDPLVGCGGVVPSALCSFLSAQWGRLERTRELKTLPFTRRFANSGRGA